MTYFVTCNLVWHIVWIPAWSSHESLVILMWVAKELIDISWLAKKSIKLCLGQEYLWYLDDSPTGSSFSCVYIIVTTSCLTIKLIFHVFWCCVCILLSFRHSIFTVDKYVVIIELCSMYYVHFMLYTCINLWFHGPWKKKMCFNVKPLFAGFFKIINIYRDEPIKCMYSIQSRY